MKYVRTKDGIYEVVLTSPLGFVRIDKKDGTYPDVLEKEVINQADTIEELIQLNDIVFYWQQSDDKERCTLMIYPDEIRAMRFNAITKLLIPIGDDYKCVAKAEPSFELINRRRYLVSKGVLELV